MPKKPTAEDWPLRITPENYVNRYPKAKHAKLARKLIKSGAMVDVTLTAHKKRVVELLESGYSMRAIGKLIGRAPKTIWHWRQADPAFDAAVLMTTDVRDADLVQAIESRMIKRAKNGTLSDRLIEFTLCNRSPARWRNTYKVEIPAIDEVAKAIPTAEQAVRELSRELGRLASRKRPRQGTKAAR